MIAAILASGALMLPGALNPAVTQASIGQTICVPGWTATVRPPASYTSRLKRKQLAAAGLKIALRAVEEDHVVPLSLGGDPRNPANLRPQLWAGKSGARAKDVQERRLNRAVCTGRMSLEAARAAMVAWVVQHHPYPDLP